MKQCRRQAGATLTWVGLLALGAAASCGPRSAAAPIPRASEEADEGAIETPEATPNRDSTSITLGGAQLPDCSDASGMAPSAAFDEPGQGCRLKVGDWDAVLARARPLLTYGFGPECSPREVERCESACASDDVAACVSLVNARMLGLDVDITEAVHGVAKACSLDDGEACLAMSNVWLHGLGDASVDRPRAFATRQQACALGHGAACAALGFMYKNGGDGIKQDAARGYELVKRGCRLGSIAACNDYGWSLVSDSWGKPRDVERALLLFTFACERGHAFGCGSLGEAFEKGWGVPVDRRLAQAFWALQCDHHGHPQACAAATRLAE